MDESFSMKSKISDLEVEVEKQEKIDETNKIQKRLSNIIQVREITKDYDIGDYIVRAVDNVTFNVKRGDFIVIQGSSGAGKTTLLQIIAGLDESTAGEIYMEWVRITDFEEETMATFRVLNIGFIFQNYNLVSSLTALENIMLPQQLAGVEYDLQVKRAKELLKLVRLPDRDEHLPYQLSAGEQQRVGIARALANGPPIILADEPTANLDKKSSDIIADLFIKLSQEGKTVIVVSHDDRLINHAFRLITFEDGKITEDNRIKLPDEIVDDTGSDLNIPVKWNVKKGLKVNSEIENDNVDVNINKQL